MTSGDPLPGSLEDRIAIQELLCRYAYLIDSGRSKDVPDEIFAEDAVDDHGAAGVTIGCEALRRIFATGTDVLEATAHTITNCVINVRGNSASSLAQVTGWHWFTETAHLGPTRPEDFVEIATYSDIWRREPAGWRIARRHVLSMGPGRIGRGIGNLPRFYSLDEAAHPGRRGGTWPY